MPDQPAQPDAPAQDAPASTPNQPGTSPAPPSGQQQRDAADAPLGEAGLRALEQERAARRALEQELRPLRETVTRLQGVFGNEQAPEGQDIVTTLQQRIEAMERQTAVDTLARRHGITDDADIELLRSTGDDAVRARLAERLTAGSATSTTPPPPTLQPDPGQGSRPTSPEAAEDAAYAAFFPTHPTS